MPDHDDYEQLSRKRRRVQAACDECRSKKIKCDGRQPVCSPCSQRHGLSAFCAWGARKGRGPGVTKDDFRRLQQRIRELENGQSSAAPRLPDSGEAMTLSTAREQSLDEDENENDPGNSAMMGLLEVEQQSTPNGNENSSAKSFTNQIRRVLNRHSVFHDAQASMSAKSSPAKPQRKYRRLDDYVLPPRQRADHLLNCYWGLVNTLYPFLDKKMFLSMYRRLWTGGELGEEFPTFICTLNIVFALACNLDGAIEPADRAHEADIFYRRADEFLELDLIQERSIFSVQCFLLLAQYLQSTHDSQQCWIFVGLAIRIAQSLGLDLPQATGASVNEEVDTIRRVWHGCVLMDRTLSMTYGRPPMITPQAATAVPLPTAYIGNSDYADDVGLWAADFSNDFFVETLKLYEVMAELLTAWYSTPLHSWGLNGDLLASDSGGLGAMAIGKVLEMDRGIWVWRCSLPAHLKWDLSDRTRSKVHQRQSNVLRMRHHHIRILLFRPLLAKFCARETVPPSDERILPWKIVLQCCITCVETAVDTISFLHELITATPLGQVDELLPAWWYTIFYVYSAATVLVAARLHPDIIAAISENVVMNSWQKVLETFHFFSAFSKHAKRCAAALRALFDQVSEHRSSSHQNQPHQVAQPQDLLQQTPQPGWRIHRARNSESFSNPAETSPLGSVLSQQRNGVTMDHPSYQDVINFSSSLDLLDLPDIGIDLDQMSWLTSFPTALQ